MSIEVKLTFYNVDPDHREKLENAIWEYLNCFYGCCNIDVEMSYMEDTSQIVVCEGEDSEIMSKDIESILQEITQKEVQNNGK